MVDDRTYGAETGSVGAKFIPTGGKYHPKTNWKYVLLIYVISTGIFLTGGLTPKNIKYIEGSDSPFMKAFGKMADKSWYQVNLR